MAMIVFRQPQPGERPMARVMQNVFGKRGIRAMCVLAISTLVLAGSTQIRGAEAEPAPPAGQTYTGSKACGACHFDQFMAWKKDKHSKAFDILTAKYAKDVKCLKCHTTGYGEATGYKDGATALAGVTCENCHGPGSEHEKVSKPFAQVKKLTPEQEKAVRDSIWKVLPGNVCIECHETKGHKPSSTPKEMQPKK
jgi:hypothetical protein